MVYFSSSSSSPYRLFLCDLNIYFDYLHFVAVSSSLVWFSLQFVIFFTYVAMILRKRNIVAKLLILAITGFCFFLFFVQFDHITINDLEDILTNHEEEIYEAAIQQDLRLQVPGLGDRGAAVNLTGELGDKAAKDIALLSLNEELSVHLSYHRTVPDPRHPECREKEQYYLSRRDKYPTTSVVIVFFDEPYSVLIRTVHSVLDTVTSKPELLHEIILVDDGSDLPQLGPKLDYYIKTRLSKKVKLLRLPKR